MSLSPFNYKMEAWHLMAVSMAGLEWISLHKPTATAQAGSVGVSTRERDQFEQATAQIH